MRSLRIVLLLEHIYSAPNASCWNQSKSLCFHQPRQTPAPTPPKYIVQGVHKAVCPDVRVPCLRRLPSATSGVHHVALKRCTYMAANVMSTTAERTFERVKFQLNFVAAMGAFSLRLAQLGPAFASLSSQALGRVTKCMPCSEPPEDRVIKELNLVTECILQAQNAPTLAALASHLALFAKISRRLPAS